MEKFEFFSKFNDALIIINEKKEVLFKNNAFKRTFKDFVNLDKFSHQLSFDICMLEGDNMETYSPVFHALKSPENFFASVSYQNLLKETYYYNITAIKRNRYVVIFFIDVSAQYKLKTLQKEHELLSNNYKKLYEENKNFIKIKQQAQAQAIKMVLINKISNNIRESIDTSKIIIAALKELSSMFGAFKIYYAAALDHSFKIEQINPAFKHEEGTIVEYDDRTYESIENKQIVVSNCLKEHKNVDNFNKCAFRIIVPIYHMDKLLGVIVILSYQKRELNDEIDILESVAAQLGSAIIQASLFDEINKKNDQLQEALQELKDTQLQLINAEKMVSLGQLIAGVAHEINTPLASINSNNSIIAKFIKKIDNEDIAQTLKEINELDHEAVTRISNMVKSLKQFVRLDEAELQEANINKELDLTLDLIRHETKNKIDVIKDYQELPLIKCYPNMLNQVFMNILVNACQSIEKSGKIFISTNYKDNTLKVSIKDTGKGIDADKIDKIFTAGYTTKGVGVGTGLGLAISQKIIQKHEGKISVNSQVGVGTEFIITIPGK